MSKIQTGQLHSELFGRSHSTLQSHGLFALAKHLFYTVMTNRLLFADIAKPQFVQCDALHRYRYMEHHHVVAYACSGIVRVFATRDKCRCCHPYHSDQFCNQGIFQDFGHEVWTNPLKSPRLPFPLISSLSFYLFLPSHFPPFALASLRRRPLKSN